MTLLTDVGTPGNGLAPRPGLHAGAPRFSFACCWYWYTLVVVEWLLGNALKATASRRGLPGSLAFFSDGLQPLGEWLDPRLTPLRCYTVRTLVYRQQNAGLQVTRKSGPDVTIPFLLDRTALVTSS